MTRLVVVSHPCVVDVNQSVYGELQKRGWVLQIVVPSRWRHEYSTESVRPVPLAGLEGALLPLPILLAGRPQRHVYVARPKAVLRAFRPEAVFLEQEPFSVAAFQWGRAAWRLRIPFGVQSDENRDRPLPLPARLIRGWVLRHAAFVAARSPAAADLVARWRARGIVELVPHAVPTWPQTRSTDRPDSPFTVGFAGRLVPEKGIDDLIEAIRRLAPPVKLLIAGGGPHYPRILAASAGLEVEVLGGLRHGEMAEILRRMDVLVLPSRTTPTWAEQFGRVLVEALSQGVPVVGSDSGEIPWVIDATGGGVVFAEGNVVELADVLESLRGNPGMRATLGARGARSVEKLFSASASAESLACLIESSVTCAD